MIFVACAGEIMLRTRLMLTCQRLTEPNVKREHYIHYAYSRTPQNRQDAAQFRLVSTTAVDRSFFVL